MSAAQRRACAAGGCPHGIRDFPFCCQALAAPLVNTGVVLLGCPCTLAITGGLGRFVAPLCRREAVYDEDLLLRGLWKLCTVNLSLIHI